MIGTLMSARHSVSVPVTMIDKQLQIHPKRLLCLCSLTAIKDSVIASPQDRHVIISTMTASLSLVTFEIDAYLSWRSTLNPWLGTKKLPDLTRNAYRNHLLLKRFLQIGNLIHL